MKLFIKIFIFLFISIITLNANDINHKLTTQEQTWIDNNTVIIGIEQWQPIISFDKNTNEIDGISGKILKKVIANLNLKTKIVSKDWYSLYSNFKKDEVHLLPATYYNAKKLDYGIYSKKYFDIKNNIYVNNSSFIKSFDDLKNKKIATPITHKLTKQIQAKYPNIHVIQTHNLKDSIKLFLDKKVDAFVGREVEIEIYLKQHNLTDIKSISQNILKEKSLYFLSNISKPMLNTILQKGLDSLQVENTIVVEEKKIIVQEESKEIIKLDTNSIVEKEPIKELTKEIEVKVTKTVPKKEKVQVKQQDTVQKTNYPVFQATDEFSYLQYTLIIILIVVFSILIRNIILNNKNQDVSNSIDINSKDLNISLTKRYIPAVTLLAVFIVFSHILISDSINSNNELAKIINISGKQRMLSQRLVHLGQSYYENRLKKPDVVNALVEIRKAHKYLLTKNITDALDEIYFTQGLDRNLNHYLKYFDLLLLEQNQEYLKLAREDSKVILFQLDRVVKEYERYSNEQTNISLQYEFYLMIITLFILFLEVFFIFRPASLKIEKNTRALLDNKDYEETVIESNNNAIIAIDWTAKITTYNEKAQEIFGWTKEEMIGTRNLLNIIPPKYKDLHTLAHRKYLDTGKSCGVIDKIHELEGITKDGIIFPIQISFGSKWKIKGAIVVASIVDMTKQKKQDSLLIQQSKMASMGEMIGNIAHQWRQPLSAISTNASGLQLEKEYGLLTDETLDQRLQDIVDKTEYLSQTIDDFRNFFKQSDDKKDFMVNEVIDKAINIIKVTYGGSGISLNTNYDKTSEFICSGFANELSQVIINILNNAKDILLEKDSQDKLVQICLTKDESSVILEIYDTAGGIPLDILPKIFEPYFTTKHQSQGTGIGLYMSSQIINNHFDGSLSASNEDFEVGGKAYHGACFKVVLPLND